MDLVKDFGVTDRINPSEKDEESLICTIINLSGGFEVDAAMGVAGVPALIPADLRSLRIGGRYVEIGCSFPNATITDDGSDIVSRRLTINGFHNYETNHFYGAVDFLLRAKHQFPFTNTVSHHLGLQKIKDGLRIAHAGEAIR